MSRLVRLYATSNGMLCRGGNRPPGPFLLCRNARVMQNRHVRRFLLLIAIIFGVLLAGSAGADTYTLANGENITGELLISSANDAGVQIRTGEGKYEKVAWDRFSQEDLKKFVQVKKMEPFVEPFIEITPEEKIKRTEVNVKQPVRLERPAGKSLFGAMFSSGLGLFIILLLYAANIFAGYEVSIFRAQPVALVCGVSAVLPLIGPIIFLCMPTKVTPVPETWETAPPAGAQAAPTAEAVNPMQVEGIAHPSGGLKLAHTEAEQQPTAALP